MNPQQSDMPIFWHARAEEAYARAEEMRDMNARQVMRQVGDLYRTMALRLQDAPPSLSLPELPKAAEEAKHRVDDAISKLENGVEALRKLKIKPAAEGTPSEREN